MTETAFRVLVVGGGPVGLAAGLALARRGIAVDIVEKSNEIPRAPKASTFHPPTLRIFDEWQVLDRIEELGIRIPRVQYWRRSTDEMVAEFSFDLLAGHTRYPYRLHLDQFFITSTLSEAVASQRTANLRRGVELVGLEQDADGVNVQLDAGGVHETARYDVLLGADGMKSTVRSLVGIGYSGYANPGYHLLVGVENYRLTERFRDLAPVAMMIHQSDWVDVIANPGWLKVILHSDHPESDEATARARVDATGIFEPGYDVKYHSTYRTFQLVTPRITEGRVALLGDAAHINIEFGGMGLNSGIHDAYYLARNIGRIADGASAADELADYERARASATVESVQQETAGMTKAMNDPESELRALASATMSRDSALAFLLRRTMLDSTGHLFEPQPEPDTPYSGGVS
jgi:3-(3-hydroxy-phenyl)propionate hydroxylase